MAKTFAPRVSKRDRVKIDRTDRLDRDLFKVADNKLLKGARLDQIELAKIVVKEQVRTKFNDKSIQELANTIEMNGLIQPLVLHNDGSRYRLICGERRFRAMSLIDMKMAPCFVLDDKSEKELMAIQFSENSSREELHYIDKADGILNYQVATKASERKIQAALGISKSEVHRSLLIAKMATDLKEAAKAFNIEKYVLLEFDAITQCDEKDVIRVEITSGKITKRTALKKSIKDHGLAPKTTRKSTKPSISTDDILKLMKEAKVDVNSNELLAKMMKETMHVNQRN